MTTLPRHRDLALGALSLAAGLFGIPAIVLTGEMLTVSGILAIVAVIAGNWRPLEDEEMTGPSAPLHLAKQFK